MPAESDFFQIKKEFMMEREEREVLAAKLNAKIRTSFDKESRFLPEQAV